MRSRITRSIEKRRLMGKSRSRDATALLTAVTALSGAPSSRIMKAAFVVHP
ncbi:MAG: hypothetical protein IPK85_12890 [Gemmatimonadetes bacterium]|nr:hypothetical protein [Gemmatimonadota bacterium]